ncbi:MAG TPA: hypothetical protein VFQ22_13675, partial [Longimicrobiales bacterium]|nr:hypothetical protein [Longimicrobiales bacterium]
MPPVLGTATGWLHYASLVLLLGAVAARAVVIPRAVRAGAGPGVVSTLRARATRLALAGALLLVVATGLVFLRQLLDFRDPFVPWTEDADLLLNGTTWGTSWMLAAAGSLVAAAAFGAAARGPERRGAWTAGAVLALALGAFPAFTGHASGTGALRPLTLTADTLH